MKNSITFYLFEFTFVMLFTLFSILSHTHAQDYEILIIVPDNEDNPCLSFLPYRQIINKKEIKMLTDGLEALDNEKFIGKEFNKLELVLRAFPGLKREDFENHIYVSWDLQRVNFDGTAPIDYALFLRQSGSSGPYEWVLAIRDKKKVIYQRLPGYYRGLNNIIARSEKSHSNENSGHQKEINTFFEKAHISQNPSDLDGDGKMDLIVHTYFELCNPEDENDQTCGNMGNLSYLPVPYFWNGKYMSCRDKKRYKYYEEFEKYLYLLSHDDQIVIKSRLKMMKDEFR